MNSFPQRKSPRMQGYNYAQAGVYFVTICTYNRTQLFGKIKNDEMMRNVAGEIAYNHWYALPHHHAHIELDAFVVMPNHIHGIILLADAELTPSTGADNTGVVPTLGTVIGAYKAAVTRHIREQVANPDLCVWQGRFHDHIIRNEQDLNRIRAYVDLNPSSWLKDSLFTT